MHLHGPLDHDRRDFLVADPHCFQSLRFGDAHLKSGDALARSSHTLFCWREGWPCHVESLYYIYSTYPIPLR